MVSTNSTPLVTSVSIKCLVSSGSYYHCVLICFLCLVNGRDIRTSLLPQQVKGLRKELYEVRDKVNALVDALADTPLITQAPPTNNEGRYIYM